MNSQDYIFSCVVDSQPIYQAQAFIWINSLLKNLKINPSNIFISIVGEGDLEFTKWLSHSGINIRSIEYFDSRNPYCNKIQQLATLSAIPKGRYLFLMDCDTAVLSLDSLQLNSSIYAKVVDFPNPPLKNLEAIYKAAGVGEVKPVKTSFPARGEELTDRYNCNGGVYIVLSDVLPELEQAWKKYANWCLDNQDIFEEEFAHHVDQVSFSMAVKSLNLDLEHLDIAFNFPTHIIKEIKSLPNVRPNILHYHKNLDQHMKLKKVGLSNIDNAITKVNQVIEASIRENFSNKIFWDFRYSYYSKLGSGVGSRGEILAYKKKLLKNSLSDRQNSTILDVGCGDIELVREFDFLDYTGIDISQSAIEICKKKKPDWKFFAGDIYTLDLDQFDLVICFDVLIHQKNEDDFYRLVNRLIELCQKRLIIGAYNTPPSFQSEITFFYKSIMEILKETKQFDEISVVGKYRDVEVIVADKKQNSYVPHKRDISSNDFNEASLMCKRPDLLRYLVDLSRAKLGFFTQHSTRTLEYSWLADKLEDKITNKYILDIGSGVCPLPLYLAEQGGCVYTVDSHSMKRKLKDKHSWNEWGFLDYSQIEKSIHSYNLDVLEFRSQKRFDVIYSISVIEHIPALVRRKILHHIHKLMNNQGVLLLTIDLIPNTDFLWNLSENKIVDKEEHGTIKSFCGELLDAGFFIGETEIKRELPKSRTDVLFVIANAGINFESKESNLLERFKRKLSRLMKI